jgi:tripartite-type tricarboxylate transporter receptor subunit TctC
MAYPGLSTEADSDAGGIMRGSVGKRVISDLARSRGVTRVLSLLAYASYAIAFGFAPAFGQATYPSKPVRVVVGFAPGGLVDIAARLIADHLSEQFGQSIVIENKGGAAGNLASKMVAGAAPDGYTLLITSSAVAVNAVATSGAIDPRTELTPVALIASAPTIFVAKQSVSAKNLMDYVRSMKDGRFTYSSSGAGTVDHLTAEYLFKAVPGLNGTHVPFSSGSQVLNAVLGGHVDLAATTPAATLPFLKDDAGLRVLGVASQRRFALLPDAPSTAEIGFPPLESASWVGMFAPGALSPAIADTLNRAVNKALSEPAFRERLHTLGYDFQPRSSAEMVDFVNAEITQWGDIIKSIGYAVN